MARSLQSHGQRSRVYVPILLHIFRQKFVPGVEVIEFTIADIRAASVALGVTAANIPDLIYRIKARTILPEEILGLGFHILRPVGRGRYVLEQAESTLIDFPDCPIEDIVDQTPMVVKVLLGPVLGNVDEQGLLAVVRYNDLISRFLKVESYHLKGHVRKSVQGVGQAEVDDVHVALPTEPGTQAIIIPVEAKAKDEPINRAQIAMQIMYAHQAFPGHPVRPLAIKLFPDGEILLILQLQSYREVGWPRS